MKNLMDIPKYKSFIADRDQFLDHINHRNRMEIDDLLRNTFSHVVYAIESLYRNYETSQFNYAYLKQLIHLCEGTCDHLFAATSTQIEKLALKNRKEMYDFTYASEIAAIGRVLGKAPDHAKPLDRKNHPSPGGGSLQARIGLAFDKLKRNLVTVVQQSAIRDATTDEMKALLLKKIPRINRVKMPKRHLKPPAAFQEARAPSVDVTTQIVDDEVWSELLKKYKEDYVPKARGPTDVIDIGDQISEEYDAYYTWELEQELTEDFVNNVRAGQVQAANDQGIEDMMVIAIIDDKTDDCCLWRDGLTFTQIEDALNGDHADDECDGVSPPYHMNCRCTMSPVTDYLPEAPESDIEDFQSWLES
jgi:hypothetical protein